MNQKSSEGECGSISPFRMFRDDSDSSAGNRTRIFKESDTIFQIIQTAAEPAGRAGVYAHS